MALKVNDKIRYSWQIMADILRAIAAEPQEKPTIAGAKVPSDWRYHTVIFELSPFDAAYVDIDYILAALTAMQLKARHYPGTITITWPRAETKTTGKTAG